MREVAVDLGDDRFDVRYDPARVGPEELLGAVRTLGYEPELTSSAPARTVVECVALPALPRDLQELFARARAGARPVLLDFFAPG